MESLVRPRGIVLTSQLLNQFKNRFEQQEKLTITIFDPYGIGGRVWRKDQWTGLIMNTPADQISLFTDASVNMTSRVFDGPSLFEWSSSAEAQKYLTTNDYPETIKTAATNLDGRDYAPRVLYGAYINWFYKELIKQCPIEAT
ncbi:FAD/NAD(P)-binding protein [Lentilactobacillus kisonensis]|uniref:FAD/NAD(P)-binding protein n=1 Tax=Lentilactobacillus kisonensis TaxID=481722 RepID=UPI000A82DFCC|nr:FAD/NAD(P)-binding protein [Lentilactobacillus kisonensis]